MKYIIALFLFCFLVGDLAAQTVKLKGKIVDQNGQPVGFASVYQKSTTKGTSANSEGEYSLNLPPGSYEVVFRAIGYKPAIKIVEIKGNTELNVVLETETYQLNDVIIHSGGEDPAFSIIRNAIKKRKSYRNEVKSFTCDVYIKGLQKLLAAPKKFLGKDIGVITRQMGLDSSRTGIIYLSESESKFSYLQPDKYREEMIASKFSGSNRAFSFNRASDMRLNLYENLQDFGGGLSNRPFISPIADNALFYYNYKYLGSTEENGETINKIEIIPKRNSDPVFKGVIYIIEDSWRLNGAEIYITKESNISLVDTLKINQQFLPVSKKIWMPVSMKFEFTGGLFGFRFGGYFIAIYKNYEIEPSLNKGDFKEVIKIVKGVNKKDSDYWAEARPIPLTDAEKKDYLKKDSLAQKRESKSYLDSLDKVNNKFKVVQFLIGTGYNLRNRYEKKYYNFSSLKDAVFYNTVEGFGINYATTYTKQIDSLNNKYLRITGKARYGFTSEKFYASISATVPVKSYTLGFKLGSDVVDLNNLGSISQFGNTINSLLYEHNFAKFYEKKFVSASAQHRLGGVVASGNLEWANRKWLPNLSDYKWHDVKDREFTSNNPFMPTADLPLFPENQSFKFVTRLAYDFSAKYATYPTGRYYLPSKYPTLGINYIKGLGGVFGSDVDYDLLSADLSKSNISAGFYGKFSFYLAVGKFLNNNKIYYVDFKHFIGTQSLSYEPKPNSFILMDYYPNSTYQSYFEAHVEHNFSGFITNKIPLIRKLKLQELVGFNYLTTPKTANYSEFYFGLQYLKFRAIYGWAHQNSKLLRNDFRISYQF